MIERMDTSRTASGAPGLHGLPVFGSAAAGLLLGHALSYMLAIPDPYHRDVLLTRTGHGYLPAAAQATMILILAAAAADPRAGVVQPRSPGRTRTVHLDRRQARVRADRGVRRPGDPRTHRGRRTARRPRARPPARHRRRRAGLRFPRRSRHPRLVRPYLGTDRPRRDRKVGRAPPADPGRSSPSDRWPHARSERRLRSKRPSASLR